MCYINATIVAHSNQCLDVNYNKNFALDIGVGYLVPITHQQYLSLQNDYPVGQLDGLPVHVAKADFKKDGDKVICVEGGIYTSKSLSVHIARMRTLAAQELPESSLFMYALANGATLKPGLR